MSLRTGLFTWATHLPSLSAVGIHIFWAGPAFQRASPLDCLGLGLYSHLSHRKQDTERGQGGKEGGGRGWGGEVTKGAHDQKCLGYEEKKKSKTPGLKRCRVVGAVGKRHRGAE